ncbi:L-2-hydroxyglutarate oxidase [Arthrobacter sp. S41]|uniref:L-2-hydroxyglutarate oxidase n=1 Tax=Arthrobacter sp. S41 TaxID=2509721 RepID=UPI0010365231|nr:L-2-hydroxyglutarate oxidase [Arthrobacter sp. S41]TAP27089.1 L-2-hydroxyglutarate oxidase [Arthrobacter sp. S41]
MEQHIGIIGGGILGIAIARAITLQTGYRVSVLEKESLLASHQTGRNSGVVHAGLYYQPGSLKAQLCARGKALTREYCQEHALPYRALGKLVVALGDDQLGRLADMEQRAIANQVPGLARLSRDELVQIEPHVSGVAALHSPQTAAVDYGAITRSMATEIEAAGGQILLNSKVTAVKVSDQICLVSTKESTYRFDQLIVCAGLQSDVIARMVGADPSPKILPFRGEYWVLSKSSASMVNGMIYPVPDPRFPFLGVHFTRGVDDKVHVGPNAVPALAREGYDWKTFSFKDTMESLRWPGASSLVKKYWKMGATEIGASLVKPLYLKQSKAYLPELASTDLVAKGQAGVRAQAWSKDGSLLDDFAVDQVGPVTLLRNAPSPAATSAMAIADYVLEHYPVGRAR